MDVVDTSGRLLTVNEAARALNCSPASIRRRVNDGQLLALRIGRTGPLRIEQDAVERLLRPARPSGEDA